MNFSLIQCVASLLVCGAPELSAAASVHLVREPVRSTAADDGGEVSGGPCGGRRIALPGSHLLVCSLQQGMSGSVRRLPEVCPAAKFCLPSENFMEVSAGLK